MIIDRVNEALETFARVAELSDNSYYDKRTIEELNEAYEYDDTGITVFMLLQGLTEDFTKTTKFNASEILADPEGFANRIREIKSLKNIIESPEVVELINDFESRVIENARKYNLAEKTIEKIPELLFGGEIRRDAMRSLARLEAHQFLQGKPETTKLQLNRYVWEFWNINSLVVALRDQPAPGITMTLIRDPEQELHSFFVFGIKNGENVTILTDRNKQPHPLYNAMSRKPDREMEERWLKHWFPYRLINLKPIMEENIFGEEVVTGYRSAGAKEGLVKYNTKGMRIYEIKDLVGDEALWLMLTAEKIDEKYGKHNHQLPGLSYTGEMVVQPYALAAPEGSLVKSGAYRPLEVVTLQPRDITSESTVGNWGETWGGEWHPNEQTGFNKWIEDRYIDQVPVAVLNSIGAGHKELLKLDASVGIVHDKPHWSHEKVKADMTTFSPLVFGTEEEIRRDVQWHARHNQCVALDALARKEYEETREELVKFWRKTILGRQEALINAAATQDFQTVSKRFVQFGSRSSGAPKLTEDQENGLEPEIKLVNLAKDVYSDPYARSRYTSGRDVVVYIGNEEHKHKTSWGTTIDRSKRVCCVNGKTPSRFVIMTPDNPTALAALLGIEEKDLPWQMQHWYTEEPYYGNNILNRIDPLEWAVENPWMKLKFGVVVSFSKSGLDARRKQLGLPKYFEHPKCEKCSDGRNHSKLDCKTCGRTLEDAR